MLTTKQKSDLLFKHYLGAGSTRDNREFFEEAIKSSFVVRPDQLWTYSDRIPDGTDATGGKDNIEYIINMGIDGRDPIFYHYISEDQNKVPLVKRWIDLPLTMIDKGTDNAFLIADLEGNQVKDIIPFNYFEEYYNYVLKTEDGKRIPFGVGDWNVDTYSGIVTFYGELPDGVDHGHPPLISFYQYVGGNGFRQDTYGYDGAILPLDNVEIYAGSCTITNGSEGRTLYQHIVDKANEIQKDFVDVFGWDGADKNEGIALSFEKIVPLTYTSNQDAVKGYDQASNSEIGTLLSNKTTTFEATDNYEIVFASQKLDPTAIYRIEIKSGNAIGYENDVAQDPVNITGNEWQLYKVWLNDRAFVVLKVKNLVDEVLTFKVSSSEKIITTLLLYWSDQDKQYQPFLPKEDLLGNFGFPVVTINGRLPPSVQLGTAALATFSDVITPDYYGPRTFSVVIAVEDGTDIKSADYIVKNREDWYLNDILEQVKSKYGKDLKGTIYLRAGHYIINGGLDISMFSNAIIEGDHFATTIDLQHQALTASPEEGKISELCHLKLMNVGSVDITSKGIVILSDLDLSGVDINIDARNTGKVLMNHISANDVTIVGEQDADLPNVSIKGSCFNKVKVEKNKTYLCNNTLNEVSVNIPPEANDKTMILRGNVINTLSTKYDDLFIDNNMIFHYKGIAGTAANQIPVGTPEDHTILNSNKDELTTTGRFPIFSKDDFLHTKYAEFASPFYYNKTENIIELLYDTGVLKIVDGKLTTVIKSDRIAMSEVVFDRHENSDLGSVAYNNSHTLNDVFEHIYMWKADLDENGKIPLQELPDSVAYGGLLFVGTWSFEKNGGHYPTFKDAQISLSEDKVVNELQPGWFFIVEPSDDTTDADEENDSPVNEQVAIDGQVFTAGDWLVFEGFTEASRENLNVQVLNAATPVSTSKDTCLQYSPNTVLTAKVGLSGEEITGPYTAVWSSIQQYYSEENTANRTRHNVSSLIFFDDHADLYFSDTDSFDFKETFDVEYIEGTFDSGIAGVSPYRTLTQIKIGDYTFDVLGTGVSQANTDPNILTTPVVTKDTVNKKVVTRLILKAADDTTATWANDVFGAVDGSMSLRPTMIPGWYGDTHLEGTTDVLDNIDAVYSIIYIDKTKIENFGPSFYDVESKWVKVDRAYSDPTYSPLPHYAKVPGVENLDWYWKKNRKAGALDLSGDTIIEAFKKVNDELRKLQPKKPMYIGAVPFEVMKEYDTVSYRSYRNNVLGQVITQLDSSKTESYDFQTRCLPDGTRSYQELIFFGDTAKLTVTVDDKDYEFTVGVDCPAQEDGPVYVSKATEAMTYADHGEGYWQGFYIVVKNKNLKDGTHTIRASLDEVKVVYDDKTDEWQFQNDYAGTTNTITYTTFTPYFPANVVKVANTYVGIAEVPIADLATADMCSGVRKINLANFKKISGIELRLDKLYKDWNVPAEKLAEVKVLLNDDPEKVFCESTVADNFIVLEDSGDGIHQNLHLENFEIPVTYENKNDVLPYSTTLDFYITVYDMYNNPYELKFYTYTGVRFDPTVEYERCKAGNIDENSSFKDLPDSFGGLWSSIATPTEDLTKIGEIMDGEYVGVYQQPQEPFWTGVGSPKLFNPKTSWKGRQVGEDFYGVACFNIGHIEDATGFVFRIEGLEKDLRNYTFDKLSGSTNDVILQVCLVDPTEMEHSNAKVTAFLDADNPYDGFTTVKENVFQTPVMYAGNSTAIEKRVTFGRNKILSGDVYVRIGIKKDSGLRFTGIKLIEEI